MVFVKDKYVYNPRELYLQNEQLTHELMQHVAANIRTSNQSEKLSEQIDLANLEQSEQSDSLPPARIEELLTDLASSPETVEDLVNFLTDNIWILPFLSPTHDDSYINPDSPLSTIQLIQAVLNILENDFPFLYSKLAIAILRNIERLHNLSDHKWANRLGRVLLISDTDHWLNTIGIDPHEYDFFVRYFEYFDAASDFTGEIGRLASDKVSTYQTMTPDRKEVTDYVVQRKRNEHQIGVKSLAKNLPPARDNSWLGYEQDLIEHILTIKQNPKFTQLVAAVDEFVKYLDPDSKGQVELDRDYLPYPILLNTTRRLVREKFEAKQKLDLKPSLDLTETNQLLNRNANLLVGYLVLRKMLFPEEDLQDISWGVRPAHLNLGSVYSVAEFESYSESNQLKESGYRVDMLNAVMHKLNANPQQNIEIFELGSGDAWLAEQLAANGYHVHGLELSAHNFKQAQLRLARFPDRADIHHGSWDELEQWPALENRDPDRTSVFMWLGRSASHEETETSFQNTLHNFSTHMRLGDYLIMDMPDPESGIYKQQIDLMLTKLNAIGEQLDPPVSISADEFNYIVDSPNRSDCYNRFVPNYDKLVRIFNAIGFSVIPVDIEQVGSPTFRKDIEQESKPDCIYERVNYKTLDYHEEGSDFIAGMNGRRNMVFVLQKTAESASFWRNIKSVVGQDQGD